MGVGGSGTALQLVDDEAQLFQLVAGVDALAALTAGRDDDAVALLPSPQCRGLDTEHAGDRADRVDRSGAHPTVIVGRGHRAEIPGWTVSAESRPVSSRSLITQRDGLMTSSFALSSPTLCVQFDQQPEAGRIDEAQTRAIELDITVHAHQTRSDARHLGHIEFTEESQPAVTIASHQEAHQVNRRRCNSTLTRPRHKFNSSPHQLTNPSPTLKTASFLAGLLAELSCRTFPGERFR